jgi:hypothetical protein
MNATSFVGRVIPNLIADIYGPLNSTFPMPLTFVLIPISPVPINLAFTVFSGITGGLMFAMFGATTTGGVVAFGIVYGFFSGGSKLRFRATRSRTLNYISVVSLATPGVSSFVTHGDASDLP